MAVVFQRTVFQHNVFQGPDAPADIVFQCNVFQNSVFQGPCGFVPPPVVIPRPVSDGKRRYGKRRRTGDEELTEAEVQWMLRKIAELKKAKTEREKEKVARELEIALAQAAQDDEAAEVISETIEEKQPGRVNYGVAMRDVSLLSLIANRLGDLLRQQAILSWQAADEDDVEILMLLQ